METTIDRGIPVPPTKNRSCRDYTVLDRLETGESVLIDAPATNNIRPAVSYREIRDNKRFACRKVPGGVRVWRVS